MALSSELRLTLPLQFIFRKIAFGESIFLEACYGADLASQSYAQKPICSNLLTHPHIKSVDDLILETPLWPVKTLYMPDSSAQGFSLEYSVWLDVPYESAESQEQLLAFFTKQHYKKILANLPFVEQMLFYDADNEYIELQLRNKFWSVDSSISPKRNVLVASVYEGLHGKLVRGKDISFVQAMINDVIHPVTPR